MFSYRLPRPTAANRLAQSADRLRGEGRGLNDLTESNPTKIGLDYPGPQILAALSHVESLVYDPEPRGLERARIAVAAEYQRQGVTHDPQRVLLTASSSESYGMLFRLLCNAGESVLVPRPSYPLFEYLGQLESIKVIPYPVRYHGGWFIDADEVARVVEPNTRAIIVVNPNNPTGSFLKREELQRLQQLCSYRKLAMISDEVFGDYAHGDDSTRVPTVLGTPGLVHFVLGGLSKGACLPQAKLGWIAYGAPPKELRELDWRLELLGDTYLSVSTAVQVGAAELLTLGARVREQLLARINTNVAHAKRALRNSAVELLAVEGGWYGVLRLPRTRSGEDWALLILERDLVLTHPGYFYDFEEEAHLVITLIAPEAKFAAAITRITERVRLDTASLGE